MLSDPSKWCSIDTAFLGKDGKLISVLACPKTDTETLDISADGIIDLTENVYNGFVYFDSPKEDIVFCTVHNQERRWQGKLY